MAAPDLHTLDHEDAPSDATVSVLARWHRHHLRRFHPRANVPAGVTDLIEIGGYHDAAHVDEHKAGQ